MTVTNRLRVGGSPAHDEVRHDLPQTQTTVCSVGCLVAGRRAPHGPPPRRSQYADADMGRVRAHAEAAGPGRLRGMESSGAPFY
jgi:hypothetical protein